MPALRDLWNSMLSFNRCNESREYDNHPRIDDMDEMDKNGEDLNAQERT